METAETDEIQGFSWNVRWKNSRKIRLIRGCIWKLLIGVSISNCDAILFFSRSAVFRLYRVLRSLEASCSS